MKDTVFNPRAGDEAPIMQGHNVDGSPMADAHTPTSIECAGGLHTTANDMARWIPPTNVWGPKCMCLNAWGSLHVAPSLPRLRPNSARSQPLLGRSIQTFNLQGGCHAWESEFTDPSSGQCARSAKRYAAAMRTAHQQLDGLKHRRRFSFGESKMGARHLTVAAALLLLIGAGQTLGGEPTAAGLWQSLDEESHRTQRLVSHSRHRRPLQREPSCACS